MRVTKNLSVGLLTKGIFLAGDNQVWRTFPCSSHLTRHSCFESITTGTQQRFPRTKSGRIAKGVFRHSQELLVRRGGTVHTSQTLQPYAAWCLACCTRGMKLAFPSSLSSLPKVLLWMPLNISSSISQQLFIALDAQIVILLITMTKKILASWLCRLLPDMKEFIPRKSSYHERVIYIYIILLELQ